MTSLSREKFKELFTSLLYKMLIIAVLTDAIKDTIGQPRPHLFWRCFPNDEEYDAICNVICHGQDKIITEEHKSFPSSHFLAVTHLIRKNADLEDRRELGFGNYGTVFYGKWRGTNIAIKRIKKAAFLEDL